jgi:hypothetical protein
VHGGEQAGLDGLQAGRVLELGGECGDGLVGVVAGPVEAAVHRMLDPPPERMEDGQLRQEPADPESQPHQHVRAEPRHGLSRGAEIDHRADGQADQHEDGRISNLGN